MGHTNQHNDRVEYAGRMSTVEVADQFESIAGALRTHSLDIQSGDNHMNLVVGDNIDVEFEVKGDGGRSRLEFELSWTADEERMTGPRLRVGVPSDEPRERFAEGFGLERESLTEREHSVAKRGASNRDRVHAETSSTRRSSSRSKAKAGATRTRTAKTRSNHTAGKRSTRAVRSR